MRARRRDDATLRDVALGSPARSAPRARADIALLDASSVHVHLREDAAVTILAERPQDDLAGGNDGTETLLCGTSASLVHLGGVDVRQADLLPIAHEGVAVYGDATLAGIRDAGEGESEARDQLPCKG